MRQQEEIRTIRMQEEIRTRQPEEIRMCRRLPEPTPEIKPRPEEVIRRLEERQLQRLLEVRIRLQGEVTPKLEELLLHQLLLYILL